MMKKGFTLVELLIVLAIIGILSSIAMVSGSGATDVARVTKIVEGFQSVSAAMMMYYSDNATASDRGMYIKEDGSEEKLTAKHIVDGIKYYLKDTSSVSETEAVGKYSISVKNTATGDDNSWWLTYKLPAANSTVGNILQSRALALGLKKEITATPDKDDDGNDIADSDKIHLYDGGTDVCMKVR